MWPQSRQAAPHISLPVMVLRFPVNVWVLPQRGHFGGPMLPASSAAPTTVSSPVSRRTVFSSVFIPPHIHSVYDARMCHSKKRMPKGMKKELPAPFSGNAGFHGQTVLFLYADDAVLPRNQKCLPPLEWEKPLLW